MTLIKDRIMGFIPKMTPEIRELQIKLLDMEINTIQSALLLRGDFTNEFAKSVIVTRFFSRYDVASPELKVALRDEQDELGKKLLDAWAFAGLFNFPYRDVVASMYLTSIQEATDDDLKEHMKECEEIKNAILTYKDSVVQ